MLDSLNSEVRSTTSSNLISNSSSRASSSGSGGGRHHTPPNYSHESPSMSALQSSEVLSLHAAPTVSYTHLTLPTIPLV